MGHVSRRKVCSNLFAMGALAFVLPGRAKAASTFKPIPLQFIAALADPAAKSGSGAEHWGLWRVDPGPRGVRLSNYEQLLANNNVAPSNWKFDAAGWWLEENGLIMEAPEPGIAPGRYLVTGDRTVQTTLTIHEKDAAGNQRWELGDNATLHDVTHLRCRSARYTPAAGSKACSPAAAPQSQFPVTPGAAMPPVSGCDKQDYAVLFLVGIEE